MVEKGQPRSVSVLFSGGLDSTYLVYSLLDQRDITEIKLIYCEFQNNVNKVKVENFQIPKIIDILKKYDKHNKIITGTIDETEIETNYTIKLNYQITKEGSNFNFNQFPVWIQAGLYAVTDQVYIGYVQNDDAISYLDDFESIWKSYESIVDKLPELIFPLRKTSKKYIIGELPRDLFQEVFSCENPIVNDKEKSFIDCGECIPCKKNKYLEIFYEWKRNSGCKVPNIDNPDII